MSNHEIEPQDHVSAFHNACEGLPCYIVGKGPSLDDLKPGHLHHKDAPVICINDSVIKVQTIDSRHPLFMLQCDTELDVNVDPRVFKLLHWRARNKYCDPKYLFFNKDLGHPAGCISAILAIVIAQMMGCRYCELLCFDACVTGDCDYASCIGYPSDTVHRKDRFLSHREAILRSTKMPIYWTIPRSRGKASHAST